MLDQQACFSIVQQSRLRSIAELVQLANGTSVFLTWESGSVLTAKEFIDRFAFAPSPEDDRLVFIIIVLVQNCVIVKFCKGGYCFL